MKLTIPLFMLLLILGGSVSCSANGKPLIWTSSKGNSSFKRAPKHTQAKPAAKSVGTRASAGGVARSGTNDEENTKKSSSSSPKSITGAVRPGSN